jgi:hypothetical protein
MLLSRYNSLKDELAKGVLSRIDYRIENLKVIYTLFELIEENNDMFPLISETEIEVKKTINPPVRESKFTQYLPSILIALGIFCVFTWTKGYSIEKPPTIVNPNEVESKIEIGNFLEFGKGQIKYDSLKVSIRLEHFVVVPEAKLIGTAKILDVMDSQNSPVKYFGQCRFEITKLDSEIANFRLHGRYEVEGSLTLINNGKEQIPVSWLIVRTIKPLIVKE